MSFIKNLLTAIGMMTVLMLGMHLANVIGDSIVDARKQYESGQSTMIEVHKLTVAHDAHVDEYYY